MVTGWTPVNLTNVTQSIDNILQIPGLHAALQSSKNRNIYFNLNVCVNGLKYKILPSGYDLYVLGFWSEVFDEEWFCQCYQHLLSAKFLILSDWYPNDLLKMSNVNFVRLLHWKSFLPKGIKQPIDWKQRKFKISSLSGRVTEFRYFISAKLYNKPDVLMRWNRTYELANSIDYIFSETGRSERDGLLSVRSVFENPVNPEVFVNAPGMTLRDSIYNPAYIGSLVNAINETKDISWNECFGICPGPYITEKTWKPLINGNALIFSGQFGIKQMLEELGFEFDYPWCNEYAELAGDLDRLEKILLLIDQILNMSVTEIVDGIQKSCEHNQDLVYSNEIKNSIDCVNAVGLIKLIEYLNE
jgi:hypothetical protein